MRNVLTSVASTLLFGLLVTTCVGQQDPIASNSQSTPETASTQTNKSESSAPNPGMSEASWRQEMIRKQLEQLIDLSYEETTWSDVEADLQDRLKCEIVLDQSALDDALTPDEPITCDFRQVPGKNALRLMLRAKNATYILQNGVLLIISLDEAEDAKYFTNSFINVRPLLAQITTRESQRIGKPKMTTQSTNPPVVPVVGQSDGGLFSVTEQVAAENKTSEKDHSKPEYVELVTAESMLVEVVQWSFHSDAWLDSGQGLATIKIIGGFAVVNTTAEMADDLRDFLNDLTFHLSSN